MVTTVLACNKFKLMMASCAQAHQEGKSGQHVLAGGSVNPGRKRIHVKSMSNQSLPSKILKNPKVYSTLWKKIIKESINISTHSSALTPQGHRQSG